MKQLLVFFFLLSGLLVASDFTNEPLAAYSKAGKWYVIDYNGKEIFSSAKIFEVLGYTENAYRVRLNDTLGKKIWAFLDDRGNVMFKPNTALIFDFHDGMARSAQKNPWSKSLQIFGYYDKKGNEVIPHIYDDAIDFKDGLAFVMNADSNGFINTKGRLVIPLDWMAGNTFSENLSAVNTKDFKVGYMNTKGKMVIKMKYDEGHPFSEGKAAVYYNGKFGYIDNKGNEIIKSQYDFANPFKENHAFVAMARDYISYTPDWGFIDSSGKNISGLKYQAINDFSDGLASVKRSDKWGFINYQDSTIIQFQFTNAASFVNGLAWVVDTTNKKFGFINKNGEFVINIPEPDKLIDLRLNKRLK